MLKHNSVRMCVLCLLGCVLLPAETQKNGYLRGHYPCPNQQGQAVLTPHRRPFFNFSVFWVGLKVFLSVRYSFKVGITHPVCQIGSDDVCFLSV